MRFFRRREIPWEVVESKAVEAVPMYYEDFEIEFMQPTETTRTYIFELKHSKKGDELRKALLFARQQMMSEVTKGDAGFNVLLLESWTLTVYRKRERYRTEVRYRARPACVAGKVPASRMPPFMEIL